MNLSSRNKEETTLSDVKVPCASVLKPIFVWLCPDVRDRWDLANAAITASDNYSTNEIVHRIGGLNTLGRALTEMAGQDVPVFPTWGGFRISDLSLTAIYATMLDVNDSDSQHIIDLMRHVVPIQRFGVEPGVPMKAGWYLPTIDGNRDSLVTNLVRLDQSDRGWKVTASAGITPVDNEVIETWDMLHSTVGPSGVIPLHREHSPHLRNRKPE